MAFATTRDAQLTNTTAYNYNYMYPYLNNKMRTNLNPGTSASLSPSPISTVVKTTPLSNERRVVARPTASRSATQSTPTTSATQTNQGTSRNTSARRVIPRQNTARNAMAGASVASGISRNNRSTRDENTYLHASAQFNNARSTEQATNRVSSVRCMADYTECMNNYCARPDTAYNRCYCSSKLSQIDYKYQTEIDNLIRQILVVQGTNQWSDDEMDAYWMDTIGKYSGDNSWANLDSALDIDWASMESRVRGQTAFTTGHEYCVQHLRGCSYMIKNLRDAYKSEIGRDCAAYESSLLRLKTAAESIISANKQDL